MASIAGLYLGAELALEASEKIGKYIGLSPLIIGLLIVDFSTSLPEFFVTQLAAYEGYPDIAIGNIIGSNIANLFLIMGIAGLMVPLQLKKTNQRASFIAYCYYHCFNCRLNPPLY